MTKQELQRRLQEALGQHVWVETPRHGAEAGNPRRVDVEIGALHFQDLRKIADILGEDFDILPREGYYGEFAGYLLEVTLAQPLLD